MRLTRYSCAPAQPLHGVSAGASLALWYAYKYKNIAKILCINPVLNINLPLTSKGIKAFQGEKLYIVSGDGDPSSVWVKMMRGMPGAEVHILENVDHFFTEKLNEFIELPFKLLFN